MNELLRCSEPLAKYDSSSLRERYALTYVSSSLAHHPKLLTTHTRRWGLFRRVPRYTDPGQVREAARMIRQLVRELDLDLDHIFYRELAVLERVEA